MIQASRAWHGNKCSNMTSSTQMGHTLSGIKDLEAQAMAELLLPLIDPTCIPGSQSLHPPESNARQVTSHLQRCHGVIILRGWRKMIRAARHARYVALGASIRVCRPRTAASVQPSSARLTASRPSLALRRLSCRSQSLIHSLLEPSDQKSSWPHRWRRVACRSVKYLFWYSQRNAPQQGTSCHDESKLCSALDFGLLGGTLQVSPFAIHKAFTHKMAAIWTHSGRGQTKALAHLQHVA